MNLKNDTLTCVWCGEELGPEDGPEVCAWCFEESLRDEAADLKYESEVEKGDKE